MLTVLDLMEALKAELERRKSEPTPEPEPDEEREPDTLRNLGVEWRP